MQNSSRIIAFRNILEECSRIKTQIYSAEFHTISSAHAPVMTCLNLCHQITTFDYSNYHQIPTVTNELRDHYKLLTNKGEFAARDLAPVEHSVRIINEYFTSISLTHQELLVIRLIESINTLALEDPQFSLTDTHNNLAYNDFLKTKASWFERKITTDQLIKVIENRYSKRFFNHEGSQWTQTAQAILDEIHINQMLNVD